MPEQLSSIEKRLVELDAKLDMVAKSAERTRVYALWSVVIPLALLLLPLLAIPLILPMLTAYMSSLSLPAGF